MSALHRLSRALRGRRLVAMGLFLALTYLFANNLDPTPRYVVQTPAKMDRTVPSMGEHEWVDLRGVSNDGELVVIGIYFGGRWDTTTRLQLWDVRNGSNRTPTHWYSPEWRE